jgi:hypothetical protein
VAKALRVQILLSAPIKKEEIMEYHRVLVTGDRNWTDHKMVGSILCELQKEHGVTTIIEGGARGADFYAASVAPKLKLILRSFPALWAKYGNAAGPIRNRQMLNDKPDLVVAFHDNLKSSKGTKNMCQLAIMGGVKTLHCYHVDNSWDVRELKLEDIK